MKRKIEGDYIRYEDVAKGIQDTRLHQDFIKLPQEEHLSRLADLFKQEREVEKTMDSHITVLRVEYGLSFERIFLKANEIERKREDKEKDQEPDLEPDRD